VAAEAIEDLRGGPGGHLLPKTPDGPTLAGPARWTRDAYGSRFGITAPSANPDGRQRWYLWDVDTCDSRRAVDPAAPGLVRIESPTSTGDGTLRVHDTGIGLTEEQVHELLATIGRSSKRDELGFARHEFLGHVGVGRPQRRVVEPHGWVGG
jgi:hypothetical protein